MLEKSENLAFDPKRDVHEVDQFGWIDLAAAFRDHSVPSATDEGDLQYGNVENPEAVMHKPSDVFEAMHINRSIHDYKAPEKRDSE